MSTPTTPAVYLALGRRRERAARVVAEELAASGRPVLLVTSFPVAVAGAEVRQVSDAKEARRLVFSRLATAGLLIAGDPEAMPIAYSARRRFPGLEIRTQLTPSPGRRPAPADLAVVTFWYPTENDPFSGAFVRATTAAVCASVGKVSTLHTEDWIYEPKGVPGKVVTVACERELGAHPGVAVLDTSEGELTRVVVPQMRNGDYVQRARAQIEHLRDALPTGRIEAPLVHAHAGHFSGSVAVALAREDAKIVVTEHATFLASIFAHPGALGAYGRMLDRISLLLCVGRSLRDQVASQFPQHVDKLRIVPNPIDFDRFSVRPSAPVAPRKWLYIGRMLEHKGVHTLLEAFARVAAVDGEVTLTLVGNGSLEDTLRARIASLGLGERVFQRPPVEPDQVTALLHDHDVLVHASTVETFGMTIVEAVATETPVLVARSEGPAETLDGLDGVAGVLFDVTDDPGVVVNAYTKLVNAWDGLDLPSARKALRERYGREAVGDRLLDIYREATHEPRLKPVGDRIVVVAINPPRKEKTVQFVTAARDRGYGVDLIVLDPGEWAFDEGVTVHGLADSRPGALRLSARKIVSPVPEALVITAERGRRRVEQQRIYRRFNSVLRPRILWNVTRRKVLPALDLARTKRVVVNGLPGVTIGWWLARANPAMSVGTDLTLPERKE